MQPKDKLKQLSHSQFYPRKIAQSGGTRYISVGRILPKNWSMVRIEVMKLEGDECLLKLVRLM